MKNTNSSQVLKMSELESIPPPCVIILYPLSVNTALLHTTAVVNIQQSSHKGIRCSKQGKKPL